MIDHSRTKVLLIGTSEFPEDPSIMSIPNVVANINLFKNILIDKNLVGIPESNISVSLNETKLQIERRLKDLTEQTRDKKDTLFVYYTGHGILSSEDFTLYFTTFHTCKKYLESDSININDFKKHIKRSFAGRKIVIIDSCHSGAIIGAMNNIPSSIQAGLKDFEGTYVMTSAAEDEPSLFPHEDPKAPTYFTGRLLEILGTGLETDTEYCSLRDIFNKIKTDFIKENKPSPQQSNFNNADQLYFSINKKFLPRKSDDEIEWEKACFKNTKWGYLDFKNQFPKSKYCQAAKGRIYTIEEDEIWNIALEMNKVFYYDDYVDRYPKGKFVIQARENISAINKREEELLWSEAMKENSEEKYSKYLLFFPAGQFVGEARNSILKLSEKKIEQSNLIPHYGRKNDVSVSPQYVNRIQNDNRSKQNRPKSEVLDKLKAKKEEEIFWNNAMELATIESMTEYLERYPTGNFMIAAKRKLYNIKRKNERTQRLGGAQCVENEPDNFSPECGNISIEDNSEEPRTNYNILPDNLSDANEEIPIDQYTTIEQEDEGENSQLAMESDTWEFKDYILSIAFWSSIISYGIYGGYSDIWNKGDFNSVWELFEIVFIIITGFHLGLFVVAKIGNWILSE
ncbi:caspase family protein [Neolewinella litorea]|nr:caspase family protein [Neolewinella litorea]